MDISSVSLQAPSLLGAFIGGIFATLTPCVYPLIPITLSIVGAGKESSRPKAIYRAILFCLGIFLSYALLGLLAVSSGSFFGAIWGLPSFRWGLGFAICCYSLVSLDLIFFKSGGRISQAAARLSGNSPFGAFAAGSVSGILAAPCTGALLATILTLAATNTNPTSGIFLLLSYAAGFSAPFFLLSLSPRAFKFAPRSGFWLYGAKFLIGASMLALGVYYLIGNLITPWLPYFFKDAKLLFYLTSIAIVSTSYMLGVKSYKNENKTLRLLSAIMLATVLIPFAMGVLNLTSINASSYGELSESLGRAKSRRVPVILEFSADWCVKCKELSRDILSNEQVVAAMKGLEFAHVDLNEITKEEEAIQKIYEVRGLPSIVFLCPSGQELPIPRVNGDIEVKEFLIRLELAKAKLQACEQISP